MSDTMARFSRSVVRRACSTCRSWDLATMQATSARESRRAAVSGSSAAFRPTRRVKPNAVRVAFFSGTAPEAISEKYVVSLGLAPGQPPSMKSTPSSSSSAVMASLSLTERFRPSCWDPSRRVVSYTWNGTGAGLTGVDICGLPRICSGLWGRGAHGNKKPPVQAQEVGALKVQRATR